MSLLPLAAALLCAAAPETSAVPPTSVDSEPPEAPLAAYVRHRSEGDLPAAIADLSKGPGANTCGGILEPWCIYYRGDARFYLGDFAGAAEDFEKAQALDPKGPVRLRALARRGESLLSAGKASEAVPLLTEAVAAQSRPELRLTLGDALFANGDAAGAEAEWKRAWLEMPDHPAAREAFRRLKERGGDGRLTSADWLARSSRLFAVGMPKEALGAAKKALKLASAPVEKYRALLALGKACASRRRPEDAKRAFAEATDPRAPKDVRAEAFLNLARMDFRAERIKEAVAGFDRVASEFTSEGAAEEAAFLAAWTFFIKNDDKTCVSRFDGFVADHRTSRRNDEALWFKGFCAYRMKDFAASKDAFEQVERMSPKLLPQALYWEARGSKDRRDQVEIYRRLTRTWPLAWYGLLARARLDELKVPPEPLTLAAEPPPEVAPKNEREERAVALATLGLVRDAEAELEFASRGPMSGDDAERLAALASHLGFHGRAYLVANGRLWANAFAKGSRVSVGLLYPRAFQDDVERAAQATGVDPYFVWAIMRRESSFNPLARSPARAYGLMQLISPTARKIAALMGGGVPGVADLQIPSRSLPIAAWYLSELAGRFHHVALAAAAYNGGPSAVERWVKANGDAPLDEFVELIPFRETRAYVKNVVSDYASYRLLYGAQNTPLPLSTDIPHPAEGVAF